jgi:hypothetical protein
MATIVTRSGKGSPLTHGEVDSNFTNLNTDKLETAGGSITGNLSFGDNDKAIFGAGSDLQIYHDGSHSYISDQGAGHLKLLAGSFRVKNPEDNETLLKADVNSGVTLYTNNSAKLATTSTGVAITGNATFADNDKAIFGAGSDLQIYHDGSNSYIRDDGTGTLRIQGSSSILLQKTDGEIMLIAREDGAVELNHDNVKKLATTSTGVDITGTLTSDGLTVDGLAEISSANTRLNLYETDTTDKNTQLQSSNSRLMIKTLSDDGSTTTERLRVDHSTGDISFYEDTGTTAKLTWDASAEMLTTTGLTVAQNGATNVTLGEQGSGDSTTITIGKGFDAESAIWFQAAAGNYGGLVMPTNEDIIISLDEDNSLGSDKSFLVQGAARTKTHFSVQETGDISFYEDTGTTAKFFWDASAESLGIGTSSPSRTLHVSSGVSDIGALISSTDANAAIGIADNSGGVAIFAEGGVMSLRTGGNTTAGSTSEAMRITSDGSVGIGVTPESWSNGGANPDFSSLQLGFSAALSGTDASSFMTLTSNAYRASTGWKYTNSDYAARYDQNDAEHVWYIAASGGADAAISWSEAMRIDSSGNVVVGRTNVNTFDVVGHGFRSDGVVSHTADSQAIAYLNRETNDGDLVVFRKDNSTVGSIGNVGNNVYYSGGSPLNYSTGLLMKGASASNTRVIVPSDDTGAELDAKVSLGRDVSRFKDLYLSGDVDTSGVFKGTNGTASVPTHSFLNDPDNGMFRPTTNTVGFSTAGSEAMRIDSSGNLLVGTTDTTLYNETNTANAGLMAKSNGQLQIATDGTEAAYFNRLTSDGKIVQFRKDGSTVGSIGVYSNRINIGTGDVGIFFDNLTDDAIKPWNISTNGARDASIDLGENNNRFKDLYLSGGVYLGGTGSANKLDDYEEGTWTPEFQYATSAVYTTQQGIYRKIGTLV